MEEQIDGNARPAGIVITTDSDGALVIREGNEQTPFRVYDEEIPAVIAALAEHLSKLTEVGYLSIKKQR